MKKKLILISLMIVILSCGTKKQDLRDLEIVLNNTNFALESNDTATMENTIEEIEIMLPKFKKHQALRQKKYQLEVKLKKYNNAISTIDSLLQINKNSIDHRIAQGILLEIVGENKQSIIVLEEALNLLENKPETITIGAEKRVLIASINRIMVLKLLKRDKPSDYEQLRDSDLALKYSSIAKTITLLENGNRERLIDNYR